MNHCPNCGKALAEGELCNCTQPAESFNPPEEVNAPVQEQAIPEQAAPEQAAYQPPTQQTYYQPPQNEYYQPAQPNQAYQPPQDAPYFAPVPPQMPMAMPARTDYPLGYPIKRKYVAVILAVTLGAFGLHNFYLGKSGKALAQLLIATLGSLFFGLGFMAAQIWAFVEAVQLFSEKTNTDANGFKIQTFEEALVAERIRAELAAKENENQ